MKSHEYGDMVHDNFGDNLGLGFDDGDIRGAWADLASIALDNIILVEFGEPESTNNEDMKRGEW